MANADVIRSAYLAFNNRDLNGLVAKLDPDCDWDVVGPPDVPFAGHYHGLSQIDGYAHALMDAVHWQLFDPVQYVEQGDVVVVTGREKCVVRASGRPYAGEWVHVFRLRGGRIVAAKEFHDTAEMARAFRRG